MIVRFIHIFFATLLVRYFAMIFTKGLFVNSRCLTAISFSLLLNALTTACIEPATSFSQEPSNSVPTVSQKPEVTLIENEANNGLEEDAIANDFASPRPAVDPTRLITGNSIGNAQTCMMPADLQQVLPTMTVGEWRDGPLVDTEGVAVTNAEGEIAFYGLAVGWRVGENRPLTLFYTAHPEYETAEGIGPGTTIEMAERVYGAASLSYHTQAESREFVRFENGPENISFRTGTGDEAGIYSADSGEYYQTDEYREGATIRSVWVSDRSCPDAF